ncbi:MAG TPA: VOC family protein [Candidatus Caenarcaniphilales bacterium]
MRGQRADGLLVVFIVNNIDHEYARLQAEGVPILTPIETEPWGERFFQVMDPNGVIIQLVQWMTELDPNLDS